MISQSSIAGTSSGEVATLPIRWGRPLNCVSSICFGSTSIRFRVSGPCCISKDTSSAFMNVDLPVPVAPHTSMCGAATRSVTTSAPEVSCPMAMCKPWVPPSKDGLSRTSRNATTSLCWLGTSMPMKFLPGTGA